MKRKLYTLLLVLAVLAGTLAHTAAPAHAAQATAETTIMIYMIGSDLERDGGGASRDLAEIMSARFGSDVKIVVQTGGSTKWAYSQIDSRNVQRYEVQSGRMLRVGDIGRKSMVEESTLTDFITWAATTYPARNRALIFWDHGGGSVGGYGYDLNYPDGQLNLSEIDNALRAANVHFNWVGFDACLMGTVETACVVAPYADYLIASEESEPFTGWYYTDWVTALGAQPRMSTVSLGKRIVDDYAKTTTMGGLSLIDLSRIGDVYAELCAYLEDSQVLLAAGDYAQISQARAKTKSFGEGSFDQIDIVDFAGRVGSLDASNLIDAVDAAVVYHNGPIRNAYGLAMYYPYAKPNYYTFMAEELTACGLDGLNPYFGDLVSVLVGAQQTTTVTPAYTHTEETVTYDFSEFSWFSDLLTAFYGDLYTQMEETYGNLTVDDKGDYYALWLSEEDWANVTYIEQCIMYDDGAGYVDLGNDNYFEFDADGDLMIDYDYQWVALDGQIVPFYAEAEETYDDGRWYTYGYVPAQLNSSVDVEVMLYWDDANPYGYVAGWRYKSAEGSQASKGWFEFNIGDTLDFTCDYYDANGAYQGIYFFGDQLVIDYYLPEVSYEDIGSGTTLVYYHIKDIFQNDYYTESVLLTR